jgi:hypothetical protein
VVLQGPSGGKMDVLNKKKYFFPSMHFKLLSQVKNLNKCD